MCQKKYVLFLLTTKLHTYIICTANEAILCQLQLSVIFHFIASDKQMHMFFLWWMLLYIAKRLPFPFSHLLYRTILQTEHICPQFSLTSRAFRLRDLQPIMVIILDFSSLY